VVEIAPERLCGAKTRDGQQCTAAAVPGQTRCRIHGGAGGRPPGIPQHPNTRAAAIVGRARWVERMRAAKAAGLIERFPNGRRGKDLPPLSKDRKIRKAQKILEAAMAKRKAEKAAVAAVVERPWDQLDKAGKLSEATDKSLDAIYDFLLMDVDPVADPKLFLAKQQVALSTIANQIRLDAAKLQAQTALQNLPDDTVQERLAAWFERLDALPDLPAVIEEEASDGEAGSGA
jgi:glucans biosynthesis protein